MWAAEQNMDYLRRLILRDRNHPSVVLWSIGNEEWALESNHRGARMAEIMQAYARQFDRSEEHTSELQSRPHLVCRLLLEKKKKKKNSNKNTQQLLYLRYRLLSHIIYPLYKSDTHAT